MLQSAITLLFLREIVSLQRCWQQQNTRTCLMRPINNEHTIFTMHKNTRCIDRLEKYILIEKNYKRLIFHGRNFCRTTEFANVNLQTLSFAPSFECLYKHVHIYSSISWVRENDMEVLCRRNKIKENFASRWRQCGVACVSRKTPEKHGDKGGPNVKAWALQQARR